MHTETKTAIELEGVSLRYGRRWALVRLNVCIPAGATVLLTGDNGAGKTTLLRLLSTVLRPTRGIYRFCGQNAQKHLEAVRPRLSLVTHSNHLYDSLTARENLRLVAQLGGHDRREIDGILERVGLGPHRNRFVGHFSAGMKRRLCIGRTLLSRADVALLDEPFGQLDPGGVAFMEEVVHELRQRGTTLVIATHDHPRGKALCDLHLQLENGRQHRGLERLAA